MKKIIFVSVILCGCIFSGCDLDEKYKRTVEMPIEIQSGQKLTVNTDVGSINICENNSPQSNLTAVITGKGDSKQKAQMVAESINITAEQAPDNSVCVKINKPAEIKSNWYEVSFTINTPPDINLDLKTDVGSIKIVKITGDIFAKTDVGSINIKDASGKLRLKTDVGEIKASYAEYADPAVNADLKTDVGSITFKGPEIMSAKIYAKTDVGALHSSLAGKMEGDCCSKKLTATIGSGDGEIRLKTDVGSININK